MTEQRTKAPVKKTKKIKAETVLFKTMIGMLTYFQWKLELHSTAVG